MDEYPKTHKDCLIPKKPEESKPINFRVTPEQRKTIVSACESRGIPMASKARELILAWAKQQLAAK